MAISQQGFATVGTAGRGGPQSANKTRATLDKARTGRSNSGPVNSRRLGGGTPKPGKKVK